MTPYGFRSMESHRVEMHVDREESTCYQEPGLSLRYPNSTRHNSKQKSHGSAILQFSWNPRDSFISHPATKYPAGNLEGHHSNVRLNYFVGARFNPLTQPKSPSIEEVQRPMQTCYGLFQI